MNTDPAGESPKDKEHYVLKYFEAKTRHEAELFKTVATFAAFAVAVFGLGGSIVLALADGLDECFWQWMIGLAGLGAFVIVVWILRSYNRLVRTTNGDKSAGADSVSGQQDDPTDQALATTAEKSQ